MKFELLRKEFSSTYRPGDGGEWDGGNYPQPTYFLEDESGVSWKLEDSSCGEFGTRFVLQRDGVAVACWGSMLEPWLRFSRLSGHCAGRLAEVLGISIPFGGKPV